jgi:hypothetical protein
MSVAGLYDGTDRTLKRRLLGVPHIVNVLRELFGWIESRSKGRLRELLPRVRRSRRKNRDEQPCSVAQGEVDESTHRWILSGTGKNSLLK